MCNYFSLTLEHMRELKLVKTNFLRATELADGRTEKTKSINIRLYLKTNKQKTLMST